MNYKQYVLKNQVMNLQKFAELDTIITEHAESLKDVDLKGAFDTISGKLSELGFDVLINNKKQAEFIPSSRLGEVVSQRDTFKVKVEDLNKTLLELQGKAGDNAQLKADYQNIMDQNTALLQDLEQTKVNTEIMLVAKDALNPKDLLMFINKDNIRINANGEVLGVEAEIARIKAEKPYLFQQAQAGAAGGKGGVDGANGGSGAPQAGGINAMIRKAAGRL